jgi:hypothetical protein
MLRSVQSCGGTDYAQVTPRPSQTQKLKLLYVLLYIPRRAIWITVKNNLH